MTGLPPDPRSGAASASLLTGHTGFKGAWLALWLRRLGAEVTGIALGRRRAVAVPARRPRDDDREQRSSTCATPRRSPRAVRAARPEVVFHLAAQALVRASYREPLATFATNVMGTAHLLEALRDAPDVRVAVVVTTDKVYRNREWAYPLPRERRARRPRSLQREQGRRRARRGQLSRARSCRPQGVAVATARAGNVIGGGDWCEDRLIPDAVRAWSTRRGAARAAAAARSGPGSTCSIRSPATCAWPRRCGTSPALANAYNFGPRTDEAASVGAVLALARDGLRHGRVERRCRRGAARTRPAGSRSKWRARAPSSASPRAGA